MAVIFLFNKNQISIVYNENSKINKILELKKLIIICNKLKINYILFIA